MPIFHGIIYPLLPHAYSLLILLSIVIGEEATLLFVTFTAQGFMSLSKVLFLGLGTVLIVDIVLFYLARDLFHQRISKWKKVVKVSSNVKAFVHKLHERNLLFAMTLRRFIIGTRHVTTLYLGSKKMSWGKFLVYNTLSIIIWAALLVPLAWLAGKGFSQLLHVATRLEKLIALAIIFVLVIVFVERSISKIINR